MFRWLTVSDPTRKCPMLDSYMGHAGAIGGMYVICIWGVTQMGVVQMSFVFLVIKALTYINHAFKKGGATTCLFKKTPRTH